MAIQGDFNALRNSWSELSLVGKLFFGGSFLISASAIASVADFIFKLRGFISHGIEFYRSTTAPAVEILKGWTGIELEQYQADLCVFFTLALGSYVRAAYVMKEPRGFIRNILFIWGAAIMLIVADLHIDSPWIVVPIRLIPFLIPFLLIAFPLFLKAMAGATNFRAYKEMFEGHHVANFAMRRSYQFAKLAALNIVAVLLFVAIIAGISEGLTRAL